MSKELLKESLEALEYYEFRDGSSEFDALIEKLKAERAKPDPEPVAFRWFGDEGFTFSLFQSEESPGDPLYTAPPDQSARIAELIAQRTMHEEIIKTTTQRCVELEKQLVELQTIRGKCTLVPTDKLESMQRKLKEQKPLGYIPAYAARIIHNEGSWDAFHLYRTQTDPTDIPVHL